VDNTTNDTIPQHHVAEPRGGGVFLPSRAHRWWTVPVVIGSLAVLLAIALAAVLPAELVAEQTNPRLGAEQPAPYARIPSSAQSVSERVTFGGLEGMAERFPPDGDVYFVTVSEPRQSILSWLIGRDEPAVEFLTEEQKYGLQTPEQRRIFALESMRSSEQVAQFVALRAVGFDVEIVPGEVLVQQLVCLEPSDDGRECLRESPSAEVLRPGDRLLRAEGFELAGVEDLSRLLENRSPGDTIEIDLDRPGAGELTVTVELTSSPTEPDRTIVGFVPFDTRRVDLPFELDINTGRIGGPSAGLAFTLALIDELTPGELTGAQPIGVTGTIELDGSVGAIGGLRQKASAVAQAGVEYFLVPSAQSEEDIEAARRAGGEGLTIIPVATLDEALQVLESLGGDPVQASPNATIGTP
jgi:Lon-like protease